MIRANHEPFAVVPVLFVGIDYSSRAIHIAGVSPDEDWCFGMVPLSGQSGGMAGRGVREAVDEELGRRFWDNVVCAWVERAMFGNIQTTDLLAAVRGAILDAIPDTTVVDTIRPSVWRKEVGIPGNAKRADAKIAARAWLSRRIPAKIMADLTDDHAEAACIAWACLQQSSRASENAA